MFLGLFGPTKCGRFVSGHEIGAALNEVILRLPRVIGIGIPAPLHEILGLPVPHTVFHQMFDMIVGTPITTP